MGMASNGSQTQVIVGKQRSLPHHLTHGRLRVQVRSAFRHPCLLLNRTLRRSPSIQARHLPFLTATPFEPVLPYSPHNLPNNNNNNNDNSSSSIMSTSTSIHNLSLRQAPLLRMRPVRRVGRRLLVLFHRILPRQTLLLHRRRSPRLRSTGSWSRGIYLRLLPACTRLNRRDSRIRGYRR